MGELRWTRLSIRRYDEQFSPRVDPRGRTYYWLAGEAVEDFESGGDGPRDWPTDVAQIQANAPSLTTDSTGAVLARRSLLLAPTTHQSIAQLVR